MRKLRRILSAELPHRAVFQVRLIDFFLVTTIVVTIVLSEKNESILAVTNAYGCLGGVVAVLLLTRFSSRKAIVAIFTGVVLGAGFGWFARYEYHLAMEYDEHGTIPLDFWSDVRFTLEDYWLQALQYGAAIGSVSGGLTAFFFSVILALSSRTPQEKKSLA